LVRSIRDDDRGFSETHKTQGCIEGTNSMKRNAFWGLLTVGMTVVLTGEVNAQWLSHRMGFLGEFRKKSIVGSREELVRFPPDVPILQQRAVTIFHEDGTTVSSGQGSVIFNSDLAKAQVESDGLGVWVQLDWRTFNYTNVAVLSDLNGNLVGFFRVRGVYQLTGSGDSYTGHSYYQFLGPNHEDTGPDGWVCNDGTRISVEAPPKEAPPPCTPPQ
jgi:hypothetical protein